MKSIALLFLKNKEGLDFGSGVVRPRIPYPIFHLGSYLRNKGIKVFLIDGQVSNPKEELDKIIDEVDIIGFSVMTMQILNSLKLSDYIKRKYPEKKIIFGGVHPSLLPEQTIKDTSVDYVCQVEGEGCLYDLCMEKPLDKIKNLIYKKDGKIMTNAVRDWVNLEKEDKPIWDMMDMEKYIKKHEAGPKKGKRSFGISVGRGCVFKCTFCVNTAMGKSWRSISAENMIERIKFLKEKHNIQHFSIVDDCFELDMKRVEKFCNMLRDENIDITWDVNVRAGKTWNDERLEMVAKAGCIMLSIGAESGSERVLKDIFHKGVTIGDILYMARKCNEYKIPLGTTWMCGIPNETEEDVEKTISLLKKVVKICPDSTISGPQPFRPYPNSELYFEAIKQGYKEPQSLREWAIKGNEGFLSEEVLPWIKNAKKLKSLEFYCINAFRYPINFFHKVLIRMCKFRLDNNIYSFSFEIFMTRFYVENIHDRIYN